jgi:hypothetical protein
MKTPLIACLLFIPSAAHAGPGLDACVARVEAWVGVSFAFQRSATGEDRSFLRRLEERVKEKAPAGLDEEILELRDELAALPESERLPYCRDKVADARAATALWLEAADAALQAGENVPAGALGFLSDLDRALRER